VEAYLNTLGDTNAGLFNTSGRAYPDVSTQGVNFAVNVAGTFEGVDGTSASSPTFASVVALLNDRRLNAGKAPLGFLNPFLECRGIQRHYFGEQPRLQYTRLPSVPGLGSDHWPWNARFRQATPSGHGGVARLDEKRLGHLGELNN
ncbi:hypothetical protein BD309DRAFT_899774, partial [Dichomitus squalens]